jgi:hypothetical protein
MALFLATILTWHLIFMPIPSGGIPITQANREFFKPFDTGKVFGTEDACRSEGRARMAEYLRERGLPEGTTANIGCTYDR